MNLLKNLRVFAPLRETFLVLSEPEALRAGGRFIRVRFQLYQGNIQVTGKCLF